MLCMHPIYMREISRVSALLGVLLMAGCGGEEEPPDFGPPAETGSVVVTWSLFNSAGEAITCASIGSVETYIALGGAPKIVPCGDEQRVEFTGLTVQRYPVVIRLRGLAETTLATGERIDNVTVVGGQTVDYDHEFHFEAGNDNQGAVRIEWLVDNRMAAIGCGTAGAATVHGETTGAAVAPFEFDAPCTDGEWTQSNLRPGNYEVRMFLRDSAGGTLAARSTAFRITRSGVAEAAVSFGSSNRDPAAMLVRWTVTSSGAVEPCEEDWTLRLLIQQDVINPIETASATVACDAGSYLFEGLRAPANPRVDRFTLTATLIDELRGPLDRVFIDDLALRQTQTTTVTVDLSAPQ